jgi:hypothetical protein
MRDMRGVTPLPSDSPSSFHRGALRSSMLSGRIAVSTSFSRPRYVECRIVDGTANRDIRSIHFQET